MISTGLQTILPLWVLVVAISFCKDAVATVHGRYMPKLHQENRDLEKTLDNISDKQQLEESAKKAATLSECISKLPDHMKEMIQNKLKIWLDLDIDMLMANGCSILKRCYDYIESEHPFRSGGYSDKVRKLNEIVYELKKKKILNDLDLLKQKNLCLIGKAGSGKTHCLCEYALKNQTKTNIYLFLWNGLPSLSVCYQLYSRHGLSGDEFRGFQSRVEEPWSLCCDSDRCYQ